MLDLNLNFVNEDETTTFRDVEESGTSNSSVVNADGVNSSNAGEGDDDSSSAGGAGESFSCFNFDILKVGDAGVQSGNTYDEDRRSQNLTQSEFVTRHLFPMSHGHGGGEESGQQSNSLLLRPNTNELQEMRLVQVPQQKPTVQPNLAGKKSRRGPRSRSSQYRGVTFYRRTGRWESHIWDCGKQVYLGGFDTAHAAARAYDRAAIKFRGVAFCLNMESESSSLQWPQPCRHFKFPEIRSATRNFDESLVIGHGGFGKVYKATIHDGSSLVVAAIKRLDSKSDQGADEFWAEVKMLSKLRHCHLVSLIGYCDDGKEMILVYEYMPHGSLEDHLHKHSTHLSWLQRLKLCIGAARGLDYLHTGTGIEFGVIHRDVKSANILLHESWAAKIADFGLSKIGPKDQPLSHVLTLVKGTFGYLDPDYFLTGRLTRKSDVYAFGVVLFEVLCRKRALDVSRDKEEHHSLARWVEDCIKEGTLKHLIDSDIRDQILPKCLKGFVRIAERCLHSSRKHRPTMAEVVVTLESVLALQEKNDNSLQSGSRTIIGRMVDMLPFAYNAENSGWVDKNTFSPSTPGVEIAVTVKKTRQESFQGHDEWLGSRAVDCFTEYGEWSRYKLEEVIGTGSSGVVCSAFDTFVGEKVAIKKINDIFEQGFVATRILREILLLRLLRHPDIVEIKHILLPPSRREFSDIYVVFELMESDLHQVIKANEKLTQEQCRFFLYQLLRGLKYMHSANVFHRDLKPKNILVNADCKVKICDFGIARVVFNDTPTAVCWTDYVATRWYRAPELCGSFFSKYTQAIDTWSIGCIFAELLTGKPLFPGKSVFHQLDLMTDLLGTPSTEAISRIRHENAMKYLSKMRKKKPIPFSRKFPNADPLALRLLERMLAFDPNNRPTAEEALSDPYFKNLGKVERESSSRPITKREFEFEKRRLSTEDIRERIYKEILEYHPNMLKDGCEQPGFMYPSAFDKFKKQFSDKEEHYSKGKVASPLLRRQSLSLPRASILYPKETTQTSSIKESRTQCMTSEMPNSIPLLQFPQSTQGLMIQ